MSDGPFAGHERAEAAPRESEQRFRTVIDLVPELLWQSERDGSALWFNGRWFAYTGQTPAEAAGFGWLDAVHPEDRAAARASYLAALEAGRSLQREDRIRSVTGEYR